MAEFTFNKKQVYYEVHGTGKPLVILNGIMMSSASWQVFVDDLSRYNQLILFDFFDQGKSAKLEGEVYDHSIQVETVKALIEHLKLNKVSIYGVSYGGEIALQFALKYPTLLDRLMLFNTTSKTSYWLSEVGHAWNKATHDAESYYLTTIPVIYSPKFFSENRAWMENRKKKLLTVFADKTFIQGMIRLTNSSENYNIEKNLSDIKAPTLIVGCEYDFVTPYYEQQLLNAGIKNSKLVYVPDSGHAMMYEKPDLFVSLVLGFLLSEKDNYVL